MVHSLASHVADELVLSAEANEIRDALQEGTLGINTGSIFISGSELVDASRNLTLANITNKQTTISDSDSNFPTSGAVVDYALPLTGGTLSGNLIIDSATYAQLELDGASTTDSTLRFKEAGDSKWGFYRDYSDGNDLKIHNYNVSVAAEVMRFDYATNKVKLATGGYVNEFSTDGTLAGDSDDAVSTEKAVKTYTDTKSPIAGNASLVTVGTVATGTWAATDVGVTHGGTGKSAWTQWLIPYADTTTSLSQIPIGTDGQVLTSGGAGVAPGFEDAAGGSDNDLDPTPNSDHTANGLTSTLVAGENLVFGNIGYMKSDGKVWKADADTSSTMPGIYLCLATINAAASGSFLLIGFARDDTWTWTVGGKVYISCTAGALTQTAPTGSLDVVQVVGIATHADRLYFKPDLETVELA